MEVEDRSPAAKCFLSKMKPVAGFLPLLNPGAFRVPPFRSLAPPQAKSERPGLDFGRELRPVGGMPTIVSRNFLLTMVVVALHCSYAVKAITMMTIFVIYAQILKGTYLAYEAQYGVNG